MSSESPRKPSDRRGTFGLRALGALVPEATKAARKRHGGLPTALFNAWESIVGPELAQSCRPLRLTRGRDGGALHLAVEGPAALTLQHLAPQLIGRINQALGEATVRRLVLRPAARPLPRLAAREPLVTTVTTQVPAQPARENTLTEVLDALRRSVQARRARSKR